MSYIGNNFILATDADSDCGSIQVEDATSYPYSGNDRDEVAIAIFYSLDSFSTVEGMDLGNNTEWYIEGINGNTTVIRGYMVPLWDSGATYNAGTENMIVHHDGYWYRQTAAAPSGEPGAVGTTGWTLIDESDPLATIEGYFDTACYTGSQDYGYTETSVVLDCPAFQLTQLSCHNWEVEDTVGVTLESSKLYKYDGTVLDENLSFDSNSVMSIDLGSYEDADDGVYILELTYTDGLRSIKNEIAIIDFCDMEECYKKAFKYMLCKCTDPCDDDCAELYGISQRRNDIELMYALYHTIMMYVYEDRYKYMGILNTTTQRFDRLTEVGQSIDKLKEVVERCGICDSDDSNDFEC